MTREFVEHLGEKEIGFTNHAETARFSDKRGEIPRITRLDLFNPNNTLVEFYEILSKDGKPTTRIQKLVIRVHHLSDKFDYTYVLAREGYVVSTWANDKGDEHRLTHSEETYYHPVAL
jgi:hypothetical protein